MEVSVIIVSMNNYEVLSRCLDSIRTHTSTSYEVFVVAYLFSPENLQHLRQITRGRRLLKVMKSVDSRPTTIWHCEKQPENIVLF